MYILNFCLCFFLIRTGEVTYLVWTLIHLTLCQHQVSKPSFLHLLANSQYVITWSYTGYALLSRDHKLKQRPNKELIKTYAHKWHWEWKGSNQDCLNYLQMKNYTVPIIKIILSIITTLFAWNCTGMIFIFMWLGYISFLNLLSFL